MEALIFILVWVLLGSYKNVYMKSIQQIKRRKFLCTGCPKLETQKPEEIQGRKVASFDA